MDRLQSLLHHQRKLLLWDLPVRIGFAKQTLRVVASNGPCQGALESALECAGRIDVREDSVQEFGN